MEILKFLQGKKTYIIAVTIGILSTCKFLGYVDDAMFATLFTLLTGGGIATIGAKVERLGRQNEQ